MQLFKWLILACLVVSPAARSLPGNVAMTDNVKARLVSETGAIGPGQSIWVALELHIRDGWHTYWRNPGDSGQATTLAWTLPPGFTAGDIVWTTPHRFDLPPLVNYGYAGHAVHLVKITAPRDLESGSTALLQAKAAWLVCSDVCIPEGAQLQLRLPTSASAGAVDPKDAGLFTEARGDLPNPQPAAIGARIQDGKLTLTLATGWGATLSRITSLAFFPYDENSIEYGAPQTMTRSKDAVELSMKTGDRPTATGTVRGVLLATEESGGGPAVVPIEIAAAFGGAGGSPAATGRSARPAIAALPSLVLLAVLGGLILNLMPCVFPVLSIKAIGLVEQAKKHPAAVRAKGLVFAAGVVSSMLTLAVVLLALRAGGEEIGWGFQLQSPLFVTLMVYLLLAVGLNLSGVFEVGGGLAGVGDGLTRGEGHRAAFFTGVLTTLVATPCTAPFMAAAVGAALTQSPLFALVIFAGLGLGLSLPYLLLSFAPWTRRALPKPGAWMDTLKQIFAFPMYASAAWLLWVLAQQTSALGLGAALAGVILVSFSGWAYQKSKTSGRSLRLTALATALAAFVLAVLLPLHFDDAAAASTARTAAAGSDAGGWQPYDAARAAEITAAGRPLLINFTASWCLTCLVNERNAFSDQTVRAVFRDKGVTLMKGDWTNRDPAITKALSAFGRAGVPLYLVYNATPGSSEPLVLPQLLTPAIVRAAFVDSSKRDE
ncbi:MAG TPA: thioredoxin family protein [Steroidobacteraceae bacterium]|nr:thioredoxin family protein [Steroidobacteraceae bacterium]